MSEEEADKAAEERHHLRQVRYNYEKASYHGYMFTKTNDVQELTRHVRFAKEYLEKAKQALAVFNDLTEGDQQDVVDKLADGIDRLQHMSDVIAEVLEVANGT